MKQFLTKIIKTDWPVFALLGFVVLLFIINYQPGTILSGWDNLHPEFNFGLNIKRSIFAVWQEYQGLGLLGGMAHSADLLRQLFLLFLSFFLPADVLRYTWTFLMLFVGSSGAYYLIRLALNRHSGEEERRLRNPTKEHHLNVRDPGQARMTAFLGASYYLFNLATIQMFYVPFESFVGFFGFLPWVLLASLTYFQKPTRRQLIILVLTLLIATPAWYLQTLFVVFMIALCILLLPSLKIRNPNTEIRSNFQKPHHVNTKRFGFLNFENSNLSRISNFVLRISKLYAIIFLINSFWLLPAMYFTITNSQVNLNSKINQMATETIFLQNKEFGNLPDVMQLKGFMLKGVDPNYSGTITYMLAPWTDHLSNPFVTLFGFALFAIIFVGFIKALRSKNPIQQGIAGLFVFSFIALAVDAFPFSLINSLIRDHLPFVNQIFRFPFTKFATLTSLVYAILFAVGIKAVSVFWSKKMTEYSFNFEQTKTVKQKILLSPFILYALTFILLIIFISPAFGGHLFYAKERAEIPDDYYQLFTFFKNQDPATRIANFPQPNFWGWSFYEWQRPRNTAEAQRAKEDNAYGYSGSGFLWYGIRQPILDRAFDVWSGPNENYYFEITQALYSRDALLFEKILNKYQITWILVDKSLFNPSSSTKTLFIPELESMLTSAPYAKKEAVFGNLEVYKIDLSSEPKNFVFLKNNLPTINSYNWNNYDQAYVDNDDYISADNQSLISNSQELTANSYFYPFRTLFSQKTEKEKEYDIKEEPATISFTAQLPVNPGATLTFPSFTEEKIIPVQIRALKTEGNIPRLEARIILPQVLIGKREVLKNAGPVFEIKLPTLKNEQYPLTINLNGATYSPIANADRDIGVAFLTLNSPNTLTVSDSGKKTISEGVFPSEILSQLQKTPHSVVLGNTAEQITVRFPKIDANYLSFRPLLKDAGDIRNCDNFKGENFSKKVIENQALVLSSTDATACTSFFAENLPHNQSYAVFIKSTHLEGQGLKFWIQNTNQESIPIDVFLPREKKQMTSSFVLPPMEQFGNSYAFHFYNPSIGRTRTTNEINSLSAYPIFYNYLKSIKITDNDPGTAEFIDTSNMTVTHPNESLYIVQMANGKWQMANGTTLILSQAYDPGWKAYQVQSSKFKIQNYLNRAFPFLFGKEIKNHVKVNNWANGWNLNNEAMEQSNNATIVIVYTPQYLQYFGFLSLIVTILFVFLRPGEVKEKI